MDPFSCLKVKRQQSSQARFVPLKTYAKHPIEINLIEANSLLCPLHLLSSFSTLKSGKEPPQVCATGICPTEMVQDEVTPQDEVTLGASVSLGAASCNRFLSALWCPGVNRMLCPGTTARRSVPPHMGSARPPGVGVLWADRAPGGAGWEIPPHWGTATPGCSPRAQFRGISPHLTHSGTSPPN